MPYDPFYGRVYSTLREDEWKRRRGKPKTRTMKYSSETKPVIWRRPGVEIIQVPERKIITMEKQNGVYTAKSEQRKTLFPRRYQFPRGRFFKHVPKRPGIIQWWRRRSSAAKDQQRQYHLRGISGMVRKSAAAAENLGYALPGPFQVFTLAWQKTSRAVKTLSILVFAFILLFIPWGVFYYTGWAVGAAFMFLISLIYWVFISLFTGIAYVLVSFINGIATILLGSVVFMVESILGALGVFKGGEQWTNGRYLMDNALIKHSQIANIPSLYTIVTPRWQPWMNDTIIGHLLKLFRVKADLSLISKPFREFYLSLSPEHAVVLGLVLILIPILFLIMVYYKNRHYLTG